MKPWAIFDYDGTLGGFVLSDGTVGNDNAAFLEVIRKFSTWMAALTGLSIEHIEDWQQSIDKELCKKYGFSDPERFPESFGKTYDLLVPEDQQSRGERAELVDLGWGIFRDYSYAPLEGAIETLVTMSETHRIAVVTKGNDEIQRQKIRDSGVINHVEAIYVLGFKDGAEWEEVFADLGIREEDLADCWAIGDSIKSDVNPPVELGMNGIHLNGMETWDFEHADGVTPKEGRVLIRTNHISNVPGIILGETAVIAAS